MDEKDKEAMELELSLTNPNPEKLEEFIYMLQAENKKLRELIDDLVNTGMDNDIATRLEALKEAEKK